MKQRLCKHSGFDLDIILNENRCSMLTVLGKRGRWAKLSLHRMFLDAPEDVLTAIAAYIKEKDEASFQIIRSYISSMRHRVDYSHRLKTSSLYTRGKVYDLQEIYDEVNWEYFQGKLKLWITWFDRSNKKRGSRVVFGQYLNALKLIKINKMLDDAAFPKYFLDFIVYHEMLHHKIPSYLDEKGVLRVHSKEFKEKERAFKQYKQAKAWELEHRHQFFAELN